MLVLTSHETNEDAIHIDYHIEENEGIMSLVYSSAFKCPGDEAALLDDNGDCIKITVGDCEITLDYDEAEQVLALMLASYTKAGQKMKILKTENIVSI